MTIPTADEAVERLKQGHERLRAGQARGAGKVGSRKEELIRRQEPFAIFLSCADSRVPIEILFDTRLGDVFVVRVAGNVANPSSIASIEYAVQHIGTKLIVVMAHQNCGAVAAAIDGGDAGKNLNTLLSYIKPALDSPGADVDTVARRNARNSAGRLISESEIISKAVETGGVKIVTAFFHFDDGAVEFE
jgi:carbonic anhydrase